MSLVEAANSDPLKWIHASLGNIGLATIVTDSLGRVLFMNSLAESLTAWPEREATGLPVTTVFRIINEETREVIPDPVTMVLTTGTPFRFSNHIVLVGRDGTEWILDEGASPVRDVTKTLIGTVLIFRDIGDRRSQEREIANARAFAEGIVDTVREAIIVLDADFRVMIANHAYFRLFNARPADTLRQSLFALGDRQWDITELRELLDEISGRDTHFDDFEVTRDFAGVGPRSIVLNARRLMLGGLHTGLILLAMENITERKTAMHSLVMSEIRYRRLFETAQDGILLVSPEDGRVFDASPFLSNLLAYTRAELVGRQLWEIGLFKDIESNQQAFETLLADGYIRYDDLPLRTKDGRHIEVEFVSNVYSVGESRVIQCNIRDVTDRKLAEAGLRKAHDLLETRVRERTAELDESNISLSAEIKRREKSELQRRTLQVQLTTSQEDERHRIARELHDQMGQHLTALSLGLKLVEKSATPDSAMAKSIRNLQGLTDQMGREVHHLALELRPTALNDLGLHAAMANYLESWTERSGVRVDFHSSGLEGVRMPPMIETALYRTVQESLTNILKHASAKNVSVVLLRSSSQVSAVIEDDGEGFNMNSKSLPGKSSRRLGLLGMQERISLANGSMTVESEPGRGTSVIVRIPLSKETDNG